MLNLLVINDDAIQLSYDEMDFLLILFLTNLADKRSIRHEAHRKLGYLTKLPANVYLKVNVLTH